MASPAELSFDEILKFMLAHNGKVTNHELVKHFKVFLMNPDMRDEARSTFKKHVNTLANIKNQNNEKWLILKKKYMSNGSKESQEQNESMTIESPSEPSVLPKSEMPSSPPYRPPPPIQLNQDFNILNNIIQDTTTVNPVGLNAQAELPKSTSEKDFTVTCKDDVPPKVHPRRKSASEKSINEKRSSISGTQGQRTSLSNQDIPMEETMATSLTVSQSESMLVDNEQKISVKERKQMFNRMASESDVLKSNRPGGNFNQDNCVIKSKDHLCTPNMARNLVAKGLAELRETVKNNITDPVPTLYNEAKAKFQDMGLDLATKVPPLMNIQQNLYKLRNQHLGLDKMVYKNFEEVSVPNKFADFILADYYNEGSRIIIFCSEGNRKKIEENEIIEFFADATFDACPPPFYQLYIIHGDDGSTITKTKTKPLIYALMPDKKQETYNTVFQLIVSQLAGFRPVKFHCDFEVGAINAVLEAIPDVELRGCFYHWKRALWKKSEKMGLKSKTEKRLVGLTAVLPLLPSEFIQQGLQYIKDESKEKKKMTPFFKYVDKFWMTKNFTNMLSVFGERHRTNNIAESYHSKLKKIVNKRNTTVLRLLTALKDIEKKTFCHKRQNVNIDDDDDIRDILLQLINNDISVGLALEKLR